MIFMKVKLSNLVLVLALVVQTLDSAIHEIRIISIGETNCAFQWIEI